MDHEDRRNSIIIIVFEVDRRMTEEGYVEGIQRYVQMLEGCFVQHLALLALDGK